jgi:hypothetical protein
VLNGRDTLVAMAMEEVSLVVLAGPRDFSMVARRGLRLHSVLDGPDNLLLSLLNRAIYTAIFQLIICTIEDYFVFDNYRYAETCVFKGLLLKPLEDLDQTQRKTMADSDSKLSFVRIGVGEIYLKGQDYQDALQRFGNTTVTIF